MKPGARSTHEHRFLAKALQLGMEVDGVNIKNSVAFEYLNRRRLVLEDAHKIDPENPSWEGSRHWMGEDDAGAGSSSGAEALRTHVAGEFAKESAIVKEKRKALEAKRSKR